jgi:riboflavin biosynthesis pyrimidine reductase
LLEPDMRTATEFVRRASNQRIVIVTGDPAVTRLESESKHAGTTVLTIQRPAGSGPDYAAILDALGRNGIDSLMVGAEAGAGLITAGLANYALVALIPQFGGDSLTESPLPSPVRFVQYHCHPLDNEMVIHGHF